ncbi:MAG TPA: hypothetical protein VLQ93_20430 [Myxococcaceae bacterium]|nr:hypothetical protein [Myxococcaceae bacterium]
MDSSPLSESQAPTRSTPAYTSFRGEESPRASCLVMVNHPEHGDEHNGKEVCDEIRRLLEGQPGAICFFHDAAEMVNAKIGYANAFKALDKELAERVTEVVCSVPASIPRMMAYTVAMFSRKTWSIFRSREDAELHMRQRGYLDDEYQQPSPGRVCLRVLKPR